MVCRTATGEKGCLRCLPEVRHVHLVRDETLQPGASDVRATTIFKKGAVDAQPFHGLDSFPITTNNYSYAPVEVESFLEERTGMDIRRALCMVYSLTAARMRS
jgi:hypothetical protein